MEEHDVECPYCGEVINVVVDTSVEEQEYYEDCSVCCCPILFIVELNAINKVNLQLKRDDE